MRRTAIGLAALFLAAAANASAGVSIKLNGGLGFLAQGDYGRALRGSYDRLVDSYGDVDGTFRPFRDEWRGGLEACVPLGAGFELGIGAAYERLKAENRFRYAWSFVALEDAIDSRLTVVPVTLSLHYRVSAGKGLFLDVFGGPGYYFADFEHVQSLGTDFFSYGDAKEFSARTGAFGFQGGVCFGYALSRGIEIYLQADGRSARVRELKGDLAVRTSWFLGDSADRTEEAYFWFYESSSGTNPYPLGVFAGAKPADSSLGEVRAAGLDLSGFGISVGLRFRI